MAGIVRLQDERSNGERSERPNEQHTLPERGAMQFFAANVSWYSLLLALTWEHALVLVDGVQCEQCGSVAG